MAGQRGRDVLIKTGDGGSPETFVIAAGKPPNEVDEAYQILIADGGAIRRTWTTAGPAAIFLAAQLAADFPTGGAASVEVAQLGADGETGDPASVLVVIPA